MSAGKTRREASTSQTPSDTQNAVGLVLPGFESLPGTLLSTLAKALPHGIAVDGFLVLPVASMHVVLSGGVVLNGSEFLNFLKLSKSGSLELVLLERA